MTFPLIGADQDFALWAMVLAIAGFGFWCERKAWGRKYSGVMIVITIGIVLSNLRIIPFAAPVYDVTWEYLVPTAIPLLLFSADLRRIIRESGPTLIAFIIGSAAVVAGSVAGITLLDLGGSEPEYAGIFTATYIGGSLNFAAASEALEFRDGAKLAAAVAADNVATNLHFLFIIMLPGLAFAGRFFKTHHMDNADNATNTEAGAAEGHGIPHIMERLEIPGLLYALALAFGLAALGNIAADYLGAPQFAILIVTALAVTIGTLFPDLVKRLSGSDEAGNVMMFIFLTTIGATADIGALIDAAPILFVFAMIIVIVHMVVLLGLGKLLGLDLAEMIVASAATIGGPASGAAIASAKGWKELVTPGVLTGSLGYAIGSFLGVAIARWLGAG